MAAFTPVSTICFALMAIQLTKGRLTAKTTKGSYKIGDIADIVVTFADDYLENDMKIRLYYPQREVLYECHIPKEMAQKIDTQYQVKADDPVESNFYLIQIPTDFLYAQYKETSYVIKVQVTTLGAVSLVNTIVFPVIAPEVGIPLLSTQLMLFNGDLFVGNGTTFTNSQNMPTVVKTDRISIKTSLIEDPSKYSYSMRFYRLNMASAAVCPLQNVVAEIDLDAYHSMDAFGPCELQLDSPDFFAPPHLLPDGYIRVSLLIEDTNGIVYDFTRHFEIGLGNAPFPFYAVSTPLADKYTWTYTQDHTISTSESYFPYLHPTFGNLPNITSSVKKSMICKGHTLACVYIESGNTSNGNVTIPTEKVQTLKVSQLELTFNHIYSMFGFYFVGIVKKTVIFHPLTWSLSIICIRNCGPRWRGQQPGVFMAECPDCVYDNRIDTTKIKYTWRVNARDVEGTNSKYLTVRSPQDFTVIAQMEYNHETTDPQTKKTHKLEFTGQLRKRFTAFEFQSSARLNYSVIRDSSANMYDIVKVDIDVARPNVDVGKLPVKRFMRVNKEDPSKRIEYCTFSNSMRNLVLNTREAKPKKGNKPTNKLLVGIQSPDGTRVEEQTALSKQGRSKDPMNTTLSERCNAAVQMKAFGLSALVSAAQDVYIKEADPETVDMCFMLMKPSILSPNLHPARYADAFRILFMLFNANHDWPESNEILYALWSLSQLRKRIFVEIPLTNEDLILYTRWYVTSVTKILEHMPDIETAEYLKLDETLRGSISEASIDFLHLYDVRNDIQEIRTPRRVVHAVWSNFSDPKGLTVELSHRSVSALLYIPAQVFLDTFNDSEVPRRDNYINFMAMMSVRPAAQPTGKRIVNHGTVDFYTQLKTTREEYSLVPQNAPIQILFRKSPEKMKVKEVVLEVLTDENDNVVDSTCVVFSVARSDRVNLTLSVEVSGNYKYTFAHIDAKFPSEYLRFIGANFVDIENSISHFMPTMPSVELLKYPKSRTYFMVRVPTMFGREFGQPKTKKKKPQDTNTSDDPTKAATMSGEVNGDNGGGPKAHMPDPFDNETPALRLRSDVRHTREAKSVDKKLNMTVKVKKVTVTLRVQRSACFYLKGRDWTSDEKCENIPTNDSNIIQCNCYVDSAYSAARGSAFKFLQEFEPGNLYYRGPTLIPAAFVIMLITFSLYYGYWSYFQDRREKDCAQIHAVKNFYNPGSVDQYLVCIQTGATPGSGTNYRVSFLLVGVNGSLQTVMPEGRFCYSTGSEIWFLVSSDMELGAITGVTVNYDKVNSGTGLHPWFLRKVVVYSKKFNHIILFEANRALGIHLPSLVLAAIPKKYEWGGETFGRFWRIMKAYHILGSVVFHVPGKGVGRVMSALASFLTISVLCALVVESLGPPRPIYHLQKMQTISMGQFIGIITKLSIITCGLSLFVKNVYSLVFRKKVRVIWYTNRLQEESEQRQPDGYVSQRAHNWLADKEPLVKEPESMPDWLIRHIYFPDKAVQKLEELQNKHYTKPHMNRPEQNVTESSVDRALPKRRSSGVDRWRKDSKAKETADSDVNSRGSFVFDESKSRRFSEGLAMKRKPSKTKVQAPNKNLFSDTVGIKPSDLSVSTAASSAVSGKSRKFSDGLKRGSEAGKNLSRRKSSNSKASVLAAKYAKHHMRRDKAGSFTVSDVTEIVEQLEKDKNINRDSSDTEESLSENKTSVGHCNTNQYLDDSRTDTNVTSADVRCEDKPYENTPSLNSDTHIGTSNQLVKKEKNTSKHWQCERSASPRPCSSNIFNEPKILTANSQYEPNTLDQTDEPTDSVFTSFFEFMEVNEEAYDAGDENSGTLFEYSRVIPKAKNGLGNDDKYFVDNAQLSPKPKRRSYVATSPYSHSSSESLIDGNSTSDDKRQNRKGKPWRAESGTYEESLLTSQSTGDNKNSQLKSSKLIHNTGTSQTKTEMRRQCRAVMRKDGRPVDETITTDFKKYNTAKVTSFRHFYYHPDLQKDCNSTKLCLRQKENPKFHFLRNSRYLQKLAREHNLEEFIPERDQKPKQEDMSAQASSSTTRDDTSCDVSTFDDIDAYVEVSREIPRGREKQERVKQHRFGSNNESNMVIPEMRIKNSSTVDTYKIYTATQKHNITATSNYVQNMLPTSEEGLATSSCNREDDNSTWSKWFFGLFRCFGRKRNVHRPSLRYSSFVSDSSSSDSYKSSTCDDTSFNLKNATHTSLKNEATKCDYVNQYAQHRGHQYLKSHRKGNAFANTNRSAKTDTERKNMTGFVELPTETTSSSEDTNTDNNRKRGSSVDPLLVKQTNPSTTKRESGSIDFKDRTDFCWRLYSLVSSFYSLAMHIFKVPLLLVSVCTIVYCSWFVCVNGYYYSLKQGFDWLIVVVIVIVIDIVILEPTVFLLCAFISCRIWSKPLIIHECLKRYETVTNDSRYRRVMEELKITGRHNTAFIHTQAAPESASLYHLHNMIYMAFRKIIALPQVVFHTGVYWLIIYTICTLFLVNLQSDIYNAHMQKDYILGKLGINHETEHLTSVEEMWTFIKDVLQPSLMQMHTEVNITDGPERLPLDDRSPLGPMLMTAVRIKQIRARLPVDDNGVQVESCTVLESANIDNDHQCNYELDSENEDTRSFGHSWRDPSNDGPPIYKHQQDDLQSIFGTIDFLPKSGYFATSRYDVPTIQNGLRYLSRSSWVDKQTRYVLIDFSMLNPNSHIISSIRITFHFRRSAPFVSVTSFHYLFEHHGNRFYYMAIVGICFIIISFYNIVKELLLIYKNGLVEYFGRFTSYVEMTKVLLSVCLCYVYFKKESLALHLLNELKLSYLVRRTRQAHFVNFFEMAVLDYAYTVIGGFLAFLCIFQIFNMLSKIRRLLVFIRLLIQVVTLFFQPLLFGIAFASMAYFFFGCTNDRFLNPGMSYLMINQYFIRPRAIYHSLTENHPVLGPWFFFFLGFILNFFVVNFFIVFLNEAYSSILGQVRIDTYRVRERTKLEYVYEFLGIQSTITWDIEEDLVLKDRERDKDYLRDIKRLHAAY